MHNIENFSIFLFSDFKKMNNICPEQVIDYFANVIDYQQAKKLSSISIAHCIFHLTLQIEGHSKNFYYHCFKCRISTI